MTDEPDVNAQFAELQRSYIGKLAIKNQAIHDYWQQFRETDSAEELHHLYKELHSVAGTSSVLGYDQVSSLARQAESIVVGKEALEIAEKADLASLLSDIDALICSGKLQARTIILR